MLLYMPKFGVPSFFSPTRTSADDYPDAAEKNLIASKELLAGKSPDVAAYLAGYVAECSLKTLLQFEGKTVGRIHGLRQLAIQVSALSATTTPRSAPYLPPQVSDINRLSISNWNSDMRYHPQFLTASDSALWIREATDLYEKSIGKMRLDGVFA